MADENSHDDEPRDLLGDPWDLAQDQWGAPSHKITVENQKLVTVLRAAGWTQERIAAQVGCDPKTLRKHYSLELSNAADGLEAAALLQTLLLMEKGNMSATRKILELCKDGNAAVPLAPQKSELNKPDAPEAVGKKEQLTQDAQKPSAGWGRILN